MNQLHNILSKNEIQSLRRWCLLKQYDGFQGRPNKDSDTCYSFWIGAALKLIDSYHHVNHEINKRFVLSTQDSITGGLAKYPDSVTGNNRLNALKFCKSYNPFILLDPLHT